MRLIILHAYYAVLRTIHQIEKCTKILSEWADSLHFLVMEEKDVAEVRQVFVNNNEDKQVCVKWEKMKYVMDFSQPLCCCYVIESLSRLNVHVVSNFVLMNRCIQFCFYY